MTIRNAREGCSATTHLRLLTGVLDLRRREGLRETCLLPRLLLREREGDRLSSQEGRSNF